MSCDAYAQLAVKIAADCVEIDEGRARQYAPLRDRYARALDELYFGVEPF
ncbi:MAG: hypothetical protein V3W41_20385 [Planctomycetota bacterium]